jgi:hypothetical protein
MMRGAWSVTVRSKTLARVALAAAGTGCSDYNVQLTDDGAEADRPADTGSAADTGQSDTALDTDSGEVEIPDSGDTELVATASVYINTGNSLFSYDPATNAATRIGTFLDRGVSVTDMTDIAIDLDGYMFGVAYSELYSINPSDASVTWIATMRASLNALTFLSDGRLVGAGDDVVYVDVADGRVTLLGAAGSYVSSGDILGLPDGFLYWSVQGGDDLVRIDPTDGRATRVGSIGTSGVYGLGYADGVLYGFTGNSESLEIDAASGRGSNVRRLGGAWYGATTNPVLW